MSTAVTRILQVLTLFFTGSPLQLIKHKTLLSHTFSQQANYHYNLTQNF